jgi:hypothetical protein
VSGLVVIVVSVCVTPIVMLRMILRFASRVVETTGDTKGLRDVAVLLRAFLAGSGAPVAAVLSKLLRHH